MTGPTKQKRHRHEQNMWLIANGAIAWCYQCGAWRHNWPKSRWQKPSGIGGENPALKGKV